MSVTFTVGVPSAVTALARQRELGTRNAVFWRRATRALILWPLTLVVMAVAITIGLLGWHLPALILAGVLLVGIGLWRYSGTPECVVVYEHGLVCCLGRQRRSVRWDEAHYSWRGAAEMAILPQQHALEETGLTDAPDLTGTDGRIMLRRVSGMDRLQQLVDAELQLRAFDRGRAQLEAGEQADYPPLAITAAGIFANTGKSTVKAQWAALHSYGHAGGVVVINAFFKDAAKGRIAKEWFRGLVADATAAHRMIAATNPNQGTPQAEEAADLVADDIMAEAAEVQQRSRQRHRWAVLQGAAFAAVVLGGAAISTIHLPEHGLGYSAVCGGHPASRAASYNPGNGPHPIDFEGGSGGFAGVSDNAGVLDDEYGQWIPANAADVQLVACVTGVKTDATIGNCDYEGGVDVPLKNEQYTLTVYAAQTGTQVLSPKEIDGDPSTCPDSIETDNGSGPSSFRAKLTLSDVESAVQALVNN